VGAPRANARVGYLELVKASDGERMYGEFVEAMQANGYAAGRNLTLVRRSGDNEFQRLRTFAAEMAAARVDVIVATAAESAKACKFAAPKVPAVFIVAADPVHEGLVRSMARPGGLLTGVVTRGEDLAAKRLELLKDAFPRLRTVAIVGSNVSMARTSYAQAAQRIGVAVLEYPINDPTAYREAAVEILRSASDAILVVEDADEVGNIGAFSRVMAATRRPVMYGADAFVTDDGWGLMAYGVNLRERFQRAATLVARVLEGAKPAEMPVEQPTRYELVINLRVADDYGIVLPREFVQRADRVIR
jgi:putative ABC transport system substrate-binding protein